MKYSDTFNWPPVPVEEIPREAISTIFSFGHYDGPSTGLILWDNRFWFANRFYLYDDNYWIISLSKEQQEYAVKYGQEWRTRFHSGMTWNPDGTCVSETYGKHAIVEPGIITLDKIGLEQFYREYPKSPEPDNNADIIGYFVGWKL